MCKRIMQALTLILLLALLLTSLAAVALADPGDLDPTFDADGKVTTPLGSGDDEGYAVALQSDGKIVVAGYSHNGTNYDFALARYKSDGSLDTTFDADGKVTTPIGSSGGLGNAVALQSDGKIVVAGESYNGSNFDFALARYHSDGSLDTTFDADGKVTTPIGSSTDSGQAVALQSDGKMVVAGYSWNGSNWDFALARYNSDGSLDTTFDADGIVTTPIGSSNDYGFAMALQSDGKIVVAGESHNGSNYDFALARYNSNGSLDTTFSADGKVTTPIGSSGGFGNAVALQSDGKIVVAGVSSNYDIALARYHSDGSLDTTFDADGIVTTPIGSGWDEGQAVALQSDGKIVVAGKSSNGSNTDFALARYEGDWRLTYLPIILKNVTP